MANELVKAELREVDASFENEINRDKWATVQFNPENLKVSFANQVQTPNGSGDQRGTPTRQFVGAGTTKLALQIWFDVMALPDGENTENDVRNLTKKVAYFITPRQEGDKHVPPAVRFLWGSFQFEGIMESLEESLEYFSSDGRPLRASMSFTLTQQKIQPFTIHAKDGGRRPPPTTRNAPPGPAGADSSAARGTKPLTAAPAGANLQQLVQGASVGLNWQAVASANGIENPRLLQPGQLIDLNIRTPKVNIGGL
jgi:hypothetical protein